MHAKDALQRCSPRKSNAARASNENSATVRKTIVRSIARTLRSPPTDAWKLIPTQRRCLQKCTMRHGIKNSSSSLAYTRLSATSMHTRTRDGPSPGRQRQKFRLRRAKILSKNGSLTSRLQQKLCLRLFGLNTADSWLTVRRSDCASANARQAFPLQERRLPHDEQSCTANDLTCRQTNNGLLRRTLDKTLQPSPTLGCQSTKVAKHHRRETKRVQTLTVLTLCGVANVLLTLGR